MLQFTHSITQDRENNTQHNDTDSDEEYEDYDDYHNTEPEIQSSSQHYCLGCNGSASWSLMHWTAT